MTGVESPRGSYPPPFFSTQSGGLLRAALPVALPICLHLLPHLDPGSAGLIIYAVLEEIQTFQSLSFISVIPAVPTKKFSPLTFYVVAALFCFMAFPAVTRAAADPKEEAEILNAAESVFLSMAKKDFPVLWKGITADTQRAIVRNVHKAVVKAGMTLSEEEVRADFEKDGKLAQEYWGGYLSQFDPKTVLEESRWTIGEFKKDRGEILLRYQKSDSDARLKMFREGGLWKVGLDESFSSRQ
jgi:hypothetical protein